MALPPASLLFHHTGETSPIMTRHRAPGKDPYDRLLLRNVVTASVNSAGLASAPGRPVPSPKNLRPARSSTTGGVAAAPPDLPGLRVIRRRPPVIQRRRPAR